MRLDNCRRLKKKKNELRTSARKILNILISITRGIKTFK